MSGSSGTSGALCRRTTTGKVWGAVALGATGLGGVAGTGPTCHLCRLQHSVTLLQQQSEEQRLLLQTLRAELHVYESLPGPSAETRAGMGPMHGIPAQPLPFCNPWVVPDTSPGTAGCTQWPCWQAKGGQNPSSPRHRATSICKGSDVSCSRLLPISSSA